MPFIYETFAQRKISAEANAMTEYVLGLRGIVPNYGSQFLLQSVGTVLKVGTGMLVFTGRKGINTELLEIDVVPETLGTKTKYIVVTLDGTQQPTLASASITVSDTSEGSITSKTEDLMANVQGVVKFDLGTFTNTTSGINSASLTITCPIIEQEIIDNIKDDIFGLQGDLSDLRDDFDNLEIGARNILRGTADPVLTTSSAEGTWEKSGFTIVKAGGDVEKVNISNSPVPSVNSGIKFTRSQSGDLIAVQLSVRLQSGQYTSSVWVNGTVGAVVGILNVRKTLTNSGDGQLFTLQSGWNRLEVTQNVSTTETMDIFRFKLVSNVIGEEVTILAPQLERSNIASDWRPAPDDNFGNYLPLSGGTMTGTINALNINSTGVTTLNVPNSNGFVQKNTANAWATDAQFMKVLYANGNDQFKMGKDTTNPTFSQQKGFLNWYAGDGTLLISLRPGTSSDHGVVHGTQYGSYKLAYVNTSLNSASLQLNTTLQSNELTLQNIETQQNMVFSTPTIDYETINELEVQKQKILEQNAAIEDELNNIDRELEELEKLRKETI